MDPFVRRLVERLHDPGRPLSRNRHFHTFDTPEGRTALKVFRRLRSLQQDILACQQEGRRARIFRHVNAAGEHRIEIWMERVAGRRVSMLQPAEYELLARLPGIRDALEVREEAA
ncbi:hypothetical protein G4177_10815 [Corallococcus sp. ZKHCc1 1396]|uniref:Uncharacterized protein n=1 Tax=Corallococcus soli TaxID=2710757 RepID=A0ABR9PL66_9BACT|nr:MULTISPECIES: hypothetical protein [Corallococcus]MBE4748654.1 hypothetical protein [Corallococcus soli]MCY1031290.1 hypothetical protein [Corallococcus sp. BB11-1]